MEQQTSWSKYAAKQEPSITIHASKRLWHIVAKINFNGIEVTGHGSCLSAGQGKLPRAEDYDNAVNVAVQDCQRALAVTLSTIYSDILDIRQFYTPLADILKLKD